MHLSVVSLLAGLALMAGLSPLQCQQVADSSFDASVPRPEYRRNRGPIVAIDQAHHNFHTMEGRYQAFARLLENDGYRVRANTAAFQRPVLDSFQVLVISNAIGGEWDAGAYNRPGFTEAESDVVRDWVLDGGSLLLIADHAPMGVAAEVLARRFAVTMGKGFTEDSTSYFHEFGYGPSVLEFTRLSGRLRPHPISEGRDSTERVERVVAFTGQSLIGPAGAEVILALSDSAFDHPSPDSARVAASGIHPGVAWRDAVSGLPTASAAGRAMALALRVGRGRVVVLGEAAMLSAQVFFNPGGVAVGRAGMNVPGTGNKQFGLNLVHWLSGLPER